MIFVGDLHGNYNQLISVINRFNIQNETFIQVGDFGFGVCEDYNTALSNIKPLSDVLRQNNCRIFVIRGNHDVPEYFDNREFFGNIVFVKNYEIFDIHGVKILFVGGGISIDRSTRTVGWDYWPDEIIKEPPTDFDPHGVDIIVSHCAPLMAWPNSAGLYDEPGNLVKSDDIKGRKILQKLTKIKPRKWIYGHYHNSFNEIIEGTHFICLSIGECYNMWDGFSVKRI